MGHSMAGTAISTAGEKLIEQRTSEGQRLAKVLEDAGSAAVGDPGFRAAASRLAARTADRGPDPAGLVFSSFRRVAGYGLRGGL